MSFISEAAHRIMPCTSGVDPSVRAIACLMQDRIPSCTTCKVDAASLCGSGDCSGLLAGGLNFTFDRFERAADADTTVIVWYIMCETDALWSTKFVGIATGASLVAYLTSRSLRWTGMRSSANERWVDNLARLLIVVDHLIPATHLDVIGYAPIAAGRCSLAAAWDLWNALMSWRLLSRAAGWTLKSYTAPPSVKATSLTRAMTSSELLKLRASVLISDTHALTETKCIRCKPVFALLHLEVHTFLFFAESITATWPSDFLKVTVQIAVDMNLASIISRGEDITEVQSAYAWVPTRQICVAQDPISRKAVAGRRIRPATRWSLMNERWHGDNEKACRKHPSQAGSIHARLKRWGRLHTQCLLLSNVTAWISFVQNAYGKSAEDPLLMTACALVPWNANALTPMAMERRAAATAAGLSSLGYEKRKAVFVCFCADETVRRWGLSLCKCMINRAACLPIWWIAFTMPTTPAAGSVCPVKGFMPERIGDEQRISSTFSINTACAAPTSIGSPSGVPVPCSSRPAIVPPCRPATRKAARSARCCDGPFGAVRELDRPSWLTADAQIEPWSDSVLVQTKRSSRVTHASPRT